MPSRVSKHKSPEPAVVPRTDNVEEKPKIPSLNYGDAFSVLAGSESIPFIVHRGTLCRDSDFFVKACSGKWVGKGKKNPMHGVEPGTFDLYVHWKYSDKIEPGRIPELFAPEDSAKPTAKRTHEISELLKLSVAADHLLDTGRLQDAVIDEILLRSDSSTDYPLANVLTFSSLIDWIWEHTPPDCKLRALAIDSCATSVDPVILQQNDYPNSFLLQLAVRQAILRGSASYGRDGPSISRRCDYHVHHGSYADDAAYSCRALVGGLRQCVKDLAELVSYDGRHGKRARDIEDYVANHEARKRQRQRVSTDGYTD
ncbi:hypothetical protein LTR22_007042 [Elasticomyces elasticus]|nr:hypothetical protein LTR22_007042 [Elasticomyces elasticus]KAK4927568.1 hypothetical protein LTR49_005709 [Elasticomyces elasticus]KAK5753219.1 hypothetical protein LTS12_016686 [Elasticomyces elasticus]